MKSFASTSDNARIVVRSSLDDKNDRNNFINLSDLGSGGRRQCNPGGTLFEKEKPGSHKHQTTAGQ